MFLLIIIVVVIVGLYCLLNSQFKRTSYYSITHNSFLSTRLDAGKNGEYLTYKCLQGHEKQGGKFLFNCYLPKGDNETTEIDVLLISSGGIFVFESKNYSGWIFGSEKSKTWTQTLPQGKGRSRKEHFLNPIMQNKLHIKWLEKVVGEKIPIYSVIVFSERCTLKKVTVNSPDIFVVKRNALASIVKKISDQQEEKLAPEEIMLIYEVLYPYTQVTDAKKAQHIADIKK